MFKFLLILALIGAGGYFLFQKLEADKVTNTNSIATMKTNEDSAAAKKIIKNITKENY